MNSSPNSWPAVRWKYRHCVSTRWPLRSRLPFACNGYYGFYHIAYLPDFHKHSPGKQLMLHNIERAMNEGCAEFDFMQGAHDYKLKFKTGSRDMMDAFMCQRSFTGRLNYGLAKLSSFFPKTSRLTLRLNDRSGVGYDFLKCDDVLVEQWPVGVGKGWELQHQAVAVLCPRQVFRRILRADTPSGRRAIRRQVPSVNNGCWCNSGYRGRCTSHPSATSAATSKSNGRPVGAASSCRTRNSKYTRST